MEKSPVKQTVFFIVILVASTHCMIKTVNVIEGDLAFLNFTYSCNSTEVTIQRGNGAPFYSSRSLTPPSSSSLKLRNETDGKVCFLYLTINPVTRDDAGGYILTAYQNDPTLYEDDRIQLFVSYPPGKALCELSEEHIDPDWVRLQCTAPLGNIGGFIMCYQNGSEISPLNLPQESDGILSQTLKARVGDLVYCCSSVVGQIKDRCECKDSVWDPMDKKKVTYGTDPCPTVTTVQYPTFSQHPIDDDEFELTSPSTTSSQINSWKAVFISLLVGVVVILSSVMVYYYVMKHRKEKQSSLNQMSRKTPENCEEENGVQESFNLEV